MTATKNQICSAGGYAQSDLTTGKRPVQRSEKPFNHDWQNGEIAFLKPTHELNPVQYKELIGSGYMQSGATGHPVIILERPNIHSTHALVTTVSAYSSGYWNNNLAPWKQNCHRRNKQPDDFRSFEGSERSNPNRQTLYLEGGALMPKPETSWTYIQRVQVVPISALKKFDKSRDILRMTKDSLNDLRRHMSAQTIGIKQHFERLRSYEPKTQIQMPRPANTIITQRVAVEQASHAHRPGPSSFAAVAASSCSGIMQRLSHAVVAGQPPTQLRVVPA